VVGGGTSWFVNSDRLGWTTLALLSAVEPLPGWDAVGTLERCARLAMDPLETAVAVREALRARLGVRRRAIGLAVARIGPRSHHVELFNASLPTVLHWDPSEGLALYEAALPELDRLTPTSRTEALRLRPGAALVMATSGVLSREAGWPEVRRFTRALALDVLGGTLADAPPDELRRLLVTSWEVGVEPRGMLVAGIPPVDAPEA
jgi:hypothetical protein